MLVAGIENMGSIDSIESVADLVDGIDRQDVSVGVNGGQSRRNSYYMSSEKVEAASRAAAAVLSGHQQGGDNRLASASRSSSTFATIRSSSAFAASAAELLETTAQSIMATSGDTIMASGGSNESIVISSPSGHSRENCSNISRPYSPESFLLDVSLFRVDFLCLSCDLAVYISFVLATDKPTVLPAGFITGPQNQPLTKQLRPLAQPQLRHHARKIRHYQLPCLQQQ